MAEEEEAKEDQEEEQEPKEQQSHRPLWRHGCANNFNIAHIRNSWYAPVGRCVGISSVMDSSELTAGRQAIQSSGTCELALTHQQPTVPNSTALCS